MAPDIRSSQPFRDQFPSIQRGYAIHAPRRCLPPLFWFRSWRRRPTSGVSWRSKRSRCRTTSPILVDGKLTDEIWQQAPVINEFVQRDPAEGAAAHACAPRCASRTTPSALYVAVRAFDPEPASIVGILTRRDQRSPSDWIRIDRRLVSTTAARRTSSASTRPASRRTATSSTTATSDDSWDAVWDVAGARDADGWSAEFRIPFSQLRFNSRRRRHVRLRRDSPDRAAERDRRRWPLLSRNANGFVSQFGEIARPEDGAARRSGSSCVPYVVGQVETQPAERQPARAGDRSGRRRSALDLKYALTPGLTLTATVNPDFGQVEADPAVVNLDCLRDVLLRAPAVLRRRARARSGSTWTATTATAAACSTRGASAARRGAPPRRHEA